jgi:hypothetical protein
MWTRVEVASYFVRGSTLDANGNRQTMAIGNRHDLSTLATLRLADFGAPFLAEAKLPSIKASSTSRAPRILRSRAIACKTPRITPERTSSLSSKAQGHLRPCIRSNQEHALAPLVHDGRDHRGCSDFRGEDYAAH